MIGKKPKDIWDSAFDKNIKRLQERERIIIFLDVPVFWFACECVFPLVLLNILCSEDWLAFPWRGFSYKNHMICGSWILLRS